MREHLNTGFSAEHTEALLNIYDNICGILNRYRKKSGDQKDTSRTKSAERKVQAKTDALTDQTQNMSGWY